MWSVARRPRWIAALFLALAIAAGFSALGQWQVSRSVVDATVVKRDTETVKPLSEFADPQLPQTALSDGQLVSVDGTIVQGDSTVLSGRINGGTSGYWVMAHVVTDTGASLAVALGWAPTEKIADAAAEASPSIASLSTFTGRYLASESPQEGQFEEGVTDRASVPALINEWSTPPAGVYSGYLVSAEAPGKLSVIDSNVPDDTVTLNWLNIFYAVEWAVFAVFAVFLWFRLVRDAWEREQEEAALDAEDAAIAAELAEIN
jgi:surfeit locus 1 family protein